MQYGYCTGFSTTPFFKLGTDLLEMIQKAGFDYVEYPMMNFESMDQNEFDNLIQLTRKHQLKSPSVCNFFPSHIKLTGKDINEIEIKKYLANVLPKCKKLDVKTIILGSGPARSYNEKEQTQEEAFKQFASIISNIILPATENYEIEVLIEPFETKSCNLITSAIEGLQLVKYINSPYFALMVDLYHMCSNNEPIESLKECYPYIKHIHVAGLNRRLITQEDEYIFNGVKYLKELGYKNNISFENLLPESLEMLTKALNLIKGN